MATAQSGPPGRASSSALTAAPHVVVIGGGFGGINAAKTLARYPLRITVVDRENHHLFQPLLYQVATAALSPGDIAAPIRVILRRQRNVRVILASATGVDVAGKRVLLADGEPLAYDYLVVASGARHSYFGHPEWEGLAPGLKSIEDALEIRRRGLLALEEAERESDAARREALLSYVVIGGGPTGVELAGAIAEAGRHSVARDFRAIDPTRGRVILLEGGPRILATFPPDLAASAARALKTLGVQVRTNARVTGLSPDAVHIGDEVIHARTVLWAAGVAPSALARSLNAPLDHGGRVLVEPDLTIPGHPEVYVIGDLAAFVHQDGKPLPGVAPVALQQGQAAAHNIWRSVQGQPRKRFHYVDRGSLAVIGRNSAVAELGPVHLTGLVAWLAWLVIHIFNLISFEQRLLVTMQWGWAYLTWERSVRLITNPWRPGGADAPPTEQV